MNLATPDHLAVIDHLLTTTRSVRKRLAVAFADRGPLVGVGHDDEVPLLLVRAGRCLQRNGKTFLDDLR